MIDNTRRTLMKYMALLGFGSVIGVTAPVRIRATLKQRKSAFEANKIEQLNGYYGFGETWV